MAGHEADIPSIPVNRPAYQKQQTVQLTICLAFARSVRAYEPLFNGGASLPHLMITVEPVFGNLSNKRLTRFSLRTRRKVQGQWQLYCLVHNIEKLVNYGQLAA